MHTHAVDSLKKQASPDSVRLDTEMEFWKGQGNIKCTCHSEKAGSRLAHVFPGTVAHVGESIPVCQVLCTISSLQSSRQPHR